MTVEIISCSISTKVWDRTGIELGTPGSAVRQASVARHVTDCATRPGNEQVVDKFCLGLFDRDAGEHVALKEPVSIQQAIQAVRKYQQVHGSMNTKLRRDSKSKIETEEAHVFSINKAGSAVSSSADSNTFQDALAQLEARLNKSIQDLQSAT